MISLTICGCFPDVDGRVRNWLLGLRIPHNTMHVNRFGIRWSIVADVGSHLQQGMV